MAAPLIPLLAGALPSLIDAVAGLFPDTKAKNEAEAKLTAALLQYGATQEAQQLEVNKTEAAHQSVFVAGWRPALMWVCVSCVLYTWWIYPWLIFVIMLYYPDLALKIPKPPTEELWILIMGAMGLGGLRTFEKVKGKSK